MSVVQKNKEKKNGKKCIYQDAREQKAPNHLRGFSTFQTKLKIPKKYKH